MRPHDWPERLDAYLMAAMDRPFQWGAHDCLCFALGWHKIATGIDREAEHGAINWDDKRAAYVRLKRMGCNDLADLGRLIFGNEAPPIRLGRGDLAVTKQGTFAIVIGTKALAVGERGLVALPLSEIETGFRI